MQFLRQAELTVGKNRTGLVIKDLRISFEITKSIEAEINEIMVNIFNLSAEKRHQIENLENKILIKAGYKDDVKNLAFGDITRFETKFDAGGDVVTTLICGDGSEILRESRVSISYRTRISLTQILSNVIGQMNLDSVRFIDPLIGTFPNGYVFSGLAKDCLNELASRFNFEWSIQNNGLRLLRRRGFDPTEKVILSPESGLIGSPRPLDDLETFSLLDRKKPGVLVKCQLQPRLTPGGIFALKSQNSNGVFRIEKIVHRGDTHAQDWFSEIEGREP